MRWSRDPRPSGGWLDFIGNHNKSLLASGLSELAQKSNIERKVLNNSRRFSNTAGRDAALMETLTTWMYASVFDG